MVRVLASLRKFGITAALNAVTVCACAQPLLAASVGALPPRVESVGASAIPRGVVASIAQDRAGFLWIGTGDGLVRYDGYRFRPQEFDSPDPTLRNLGWIRAMLPSRDGRLWIGSETRGLAVYDPVRDAVQFPLAGDGKAIEPTIFALAEDVDGAIWSGTMGGGLRRFDPADGTQRAFRHDASPGSLPDDRVLALLVDRDGDLWVGTWRGLSRKRRGADVFEAVWPPSADLADAVMPTVDALLQTADGRIWAGARDGTVIRIDPANGAVADVAAGPGAGDAGAGGVSSLLEVPGGRVWVGRSTGIDIHAADSGAWIGSIRHDPWSRGGLAANQVTGLMRDHAGWVWIAGFGLGLQRHDPSNQSIRVRGMDDDRASPMALPDLRSIVQLDSGEVWAGTQTGGVAVLDTALATIGRVEAAPGRTQSIGAVTQASDGTVWIESAGTLFRFDRSGGALGSVALNGGTTHRLVPGRNGVVWACTQNGLYRVEAGGTDVRAIAAPDGTPFQGDAFTVAEGPDGDLWVGTVKGLFRLAAGGDRLHAVPSPDGAALGSPVVIGLLWDRDGSLWLDTAIAGLHRMASWDGREARFDGVSQRHGIVSRPFGANLMQDARGRIWTQLYVYDPATDDLVELTPVDGVDIGTPWFFSFARLADGRFLFGGSRGLLVVEPERFDRSAFAPPVVVTELRIDNLPASLGRLANGLQVAPHEQGFSIEFAALDLGEPGRLRYAYRLEGVDDDWIEGRADHRVASYGNLSPGNYTLRVRASNRHGMWSPNELVLPVVIAPAWWETGWARVLAGTAMLGLSGVAMQLRTRQIRRRQYELEEKVRERTIALNEASLTDPLTGLRNRRFLTAQITADAELVARQFLGHLRGGRPAPVDADLIFFLIDIDHFKRVNDELGHAAGDAILMQLQARFKTVFRESDYLVRWGGEEFLAVARATSRRHAADLAERARRSIGATPFVLPGGGTITKTCSIGFVTFPLCPDAPVALTWDETLTLADKALYCVKRGGRDGWLGLRDAGTLGADRIRDLLTTDVPLDHVTGPTVERSRPFSVIEN